MTSLREAVEGHQAHLFQQGHDQELADIIAVLALSPIEYVEAMDRASAGVPEVRADELDDRSRAQCLQSHRSGRQRLQELIRELQAVAELAEAVARLMPDPEPSQQAA